MVCKNKSYLFPYSYLEKEESNSFQSLTFVPEGYLYREEKNNNNNNKKILTACRVNDGIQLCISKALH